MLFSDMAISLKRKLGRTRPVQAYSSSSFLDQLTLPISLETGIEKKGASHGMPVMGFASDDFGLQSQIVL
jgi:hypothetical protein